MWLRCGWSRWARSRCCSLTWLWRLRSIDLLLGGEGEEGPLRELTDIEESILGERGGDYLPRIDSRLATGGPQFQFRAAPDADPGGAHHVGQ